MDHRRKCPLGIVRTDLGGLWWAEMPCRSGRTFHMRFIAVVCLLLTVAPATAQTQGKGEDYTVQVAPGIYSVTWGNTWGNMGLNVGLSVGDDGLLLIDAQDEPELPRLLARIAQISSKPVRRVIS